MGESYIKILKVVLYKMPKSKVKTLDDMFNEKYYLDRCSLVGGITQLNIYKKTIDKDLKIGMGEKCDKPIYTFDNQEDYLKWKSNEMVSIEELKA